MDTDEVEAINELKAMTFDQLQNVFHETVRWQCKVEGCIRYTRLLDFGVDGEYYKRKGITDIHTGHVSSWVNAKDKYFVCQKHFKEYKKNGFETMPLKRSKSGGIIWGWDDTGKETIIY